MAKWLVFILAVFLISAAALRFWRFLDTRTLTLTWENLVATSQTTTTQFDSSQIELLPAAARQFFNASIKEGTSLLTVAEIEMHGEFSLGNKDSPNYIPMKACQLLAPPYGFIWEVKAGKGMMQFSGSDAAFPGGSWTRFWLFGILPIARVGGTPDHALSSYGRYISESVIWSPAALLPSDNVVWEEIDQNTAQVTVTHDEFVQTVEIVVDEEGHLTQVSFDRWSDANDAKRFKRQPFGGYLSEFKEFGGFLLPTRLEAGNYFGTDEYFPFFKASVDSITFIVTPTSMRGCEINE